MTVGIENFSINPLFYEALSGEFKPAYDPLKRKHTLGRLALATVLKGEYSLVELGPTIRYGLFTYSPSWAPEVKCEVDANFASSNQLTMHGIVLESLKNRSSHGYQRLYISQNAAKTIEVWNTTPSSTVELDLELGTKLDHAREDIASSAEHFFNLVQK